MKQLFQWVFCSLLLAVNADQSNGQQENRCGSLRMIKSYCSEIVLHYQPSSNLSEVTVKWSIYYFRHDKDNWVEARNDTEISIFSNSSGYYIVWMTRKGERPRLDFQIRIHSKPTCRDRFNTVVVKYNEFRDCTTKGKPQEEDTTSSTGTLTPKVETKEHRRTEAYTTENKMSVTWSTNRRDVMSPVTEGAYTTERGTQWTESMNSGQNNVKETENTKLEPKNENKQEDKEAKTRVDSRTEYNIPETKSGTLSTEQNPHDNFNHGTVATKKASTVGRNESHILTVILATLGGLTCVVIIVIAILVYRKRQGNKPQDDNGDRSLQQDAQRDRGVRNGYEFDSQDTPEVLYAQVEKKHKTLQNASPAAQLQTNETDRHNDNVQKTETVRQNLTVTLKEETVADVTTNKSTAVPDNEDNKQELVYIQLDMDHLNKSSTPRKSAENNDEDKTEYVGIDFAKTSQLQGN